MNKKALKKTMTTLKSNQKANEEVCHESHVSAHHSEYPSHSREKKRLGRIRGQIDGVDRMIDEKRYCLDIIYQIRAASAALKALEKEIMVTHIKTCVKKAIEADDHDETQEKIQEIMDFF